MTAPAINMTDVEQIIRDNVRAQLAAQLIDESRKAREAGEEARKNGTAPALTDTDKTRAVVDRDSMQVIHDPKKGKGLGFARWVKVSAAAASLRENPIELANNWAKKNRAYEPVVEVLKAQARAMSEGAFGSGGALVPTEMASEIIELLYAQTVAMKLGAKTLEFNGSIDLGKLNAGATVGYVGESANTVPSTPTTGQLKMSRKKATALVVMTNELLRNPSVGADVIIRDDLVQAMALRRDLSVFRGAGTEFQPKGITNAIVSGNKNASAGTTLANKVADLMTMFRLVDESNVPLLNPGIVFAPRTKWALAGTLDSQGKFVFADMLSQGMLFGFPIATTTQIPTNLGGGSDSEVYFGAFNDLIIGFDLSTPMQVETFPNGSYNDGSAVQAGISNDTSPVRIIEGHDVVLRHNNTFSMITGVAWT